MSKEKAQLREVGDETMAANNALSEALNLWFREHGPTAIFKNCANCEHCPPNQSPAFCAKFKAHPPANVIVVGCPSHEDASIIPF